MRLLWRCDTVRNHPCGEFKLPKERDNFGVESVCCFCVGTSICHISHHHAHLTFFSYFNCSLSEKYDSHRFSSCLFPSSHLELRKPICLAVQRYRFMYRVSILNTLCFCPFLFSSCHVLFHSSITLIVLWRAQNKSQNFITL